MDKIMLNDFDLDVVTDTPDNEDTGIAPASVSFAVTLWTVINLTKSFATNVTESKC